MFQIFHTVPRYNNFDAVAGWSSKAEPMAYCTEAFARKLASLKNRETEECGGDDYYTAVPVGFTPSTWAWEKSRRAMHLVDALPADPYGDGVPF